MFEENSDAYKWGDWPWGQLRDNMRTSHRYCIIRKVICKEATAGGRFDSFLDSGQTNVKYHN